MIKISSRNNDNPKLKWCEEHVNCPNVEALPNAHTTTNNTHNKEIIMTST